MPILVEWYVWLSFSKSKFTRPRKRALRRQLLFICFRPMASNAMQKESALEGTISLFWVLIYDVLKKHASRYSSPCHDALCRRALLLPAYHAHAKFGYICHYEEKESVKEFRTTAFIYARQRARNFNFYRLFRILFRDTSAADIFGQKLLDSLMPPKILCDGGSR